MGRSKLRDEILGQTKAAQENGSEPLLWAVRISSLLTSHGVVLPCPELAKELVSHICWENNLPAPWKFLEKAMALRIVPPLLVLGLLSLRVIPYRHSSPAAFRMYLELLKRHAFNLKGYITLPNHDETMTMLEEELQLCKAFGSKHRENGGFLLVLFLFAIVWQLVDASCDDEGLFELSGMAPRWPVRAFREMDVDDGDDDVYGEGMMKKSQRTKLEISNKAMAMELIGEFVQNDVTRRILLLARQNISTQWEGFVDNLRLLVNHSSTLRNTISGLPEILMQLISPGARSTVMESRRKPLLNSAGLCVGVSWSALWLPLDLQLEDAMDGSQVNATSAVEIIKGLLKSLQAINGTSWHETFLGLWMAALRLERDPIEGPVPRLDTRLSMLLSITTLVVADLIEEQENDDRILDDLISSLRKLQDYQSLLTPPKSVTSAANLAAIKATTFVSATKLDGITSSETTLNCTGSLHHLIIESCIARNLLDTSAYRWPGYVNGNGNKPQHDPPPSEMTGWSAFMKGASLTPAMIAALVSTPASSYAEIERVFEIAVGGGFDDAKIAAVSILCGASFLRGWNVQEHTAYFIIRLLSPPVPTDHAPMLNVLLVGIAPVDSVQIFSLHGLVPELAGSLMAICEAYGSCVPSCGEEISAHVVFSNAFAILLKLWRFNHTPVEYGVWDVPPGGSQLTPEYLLLVRNSHLMTSSSCTGRTKDPNGRRLAKAACCSTPEPIFVDSFPKLKVWYRQHLACIASPLTGLVNGTTVHHTVDALLEMMFRRLGKNQPSSTGSSSSSGQGSEDGSCYVRPKLPAWDILEAVPFVADAALTACAHGRLSPRELCTGLKDLADYLPATLVAIVSYLSAEVTRGVWQSVFMNGTDWPSPAANLAGVEEQIKKILAATGVDVPSLEAGGGSSPAVLPLPLAAFVSLTITYKLDRASQRFLDLAGPALESLAAGCPWPCMPIVASLWTQKAKRWSDFLIFSASRTVFLHSTDAAVQLLRSCFAATLGLNNVCGGGGGGAIITSNGGIGALLGHGFGSHFDGGISPVAPGILYLRVYRSMRDVTFLRDELVALLVKSVEDIAAVAAVPVKLHRSRNGCPSMAAVMTKVKLAASLGASVLFLTGGLGAVQSLLKETLPSWFMSTRHSGGEPGRNGILRGYALAYMGVLCGAFEWGAGDRSPSHPAASKRRAEIIGCHVEFIANAVDGKISLGCDPATWRGYYTGFLSLAASCMPAWTREADGGLLRRLSRGLRRRREEELAVALLVAGGLNTMGSAAELIIETAA
ncbi:hypothetical protein M569_06182 [Genlisea aurea]|uniref:Mediator of RNA polymerase II transcription subunit 33A n=1 Tax=Genlisea aurea TaxID=192259 RepID=S8CPB9_9LAMI|nr:hypothetical protein M569_06182 [Genlisea aurea]